MILYVQYELLHTIHRESRSPLKEKLKKFRRLASLSVRRDCFEIYTKKYFFQRVLKELVSEKLPRIAQQFRALEVDLSLFTFNW